MPPNPQPRLLTAAKRARDKRNDAKRLWDSAQVSYRRAIVAALDSGIGQTALARELQTSASRIREDAMRGRLEAQKQSGR